MLTPLPPFAHSFADLFKFSCRQKPQELAHAFVRDNLELHSQLTYGELEVSSVFTIGQGRIACGTSRLHQG